MRTGILGMLDDSRVFAVEERGGLLHFYERCDEWYGRNLTPDEVRQLAAELVQIAERLEADDGRS